MVGGTEVSSAQSDHLEVDTLEEMLATMGTFGRFSGMPTGEHDRGVFWVDGINGNDGNDGETAATAKATIDAGHNLLTAYKDEVLLIMYDGDNTGVMDENANAGGVLCDTAGVHIFGLGSNLVQVGNSNGTATAVFTLGAPFIEIAGITIAETTNTVEGILTDGNAYSLFIHDNIFNGSMENGIGLVGTSFTVVDNNIFKNQNNDGIEASGTTISCTISNNSFDNIKDNAIHLNGISVARNYIYKNIINGFAGTTDYGIQIALGDNNVSSGNTMVELGTWPNLDSGSNNGWTNNHADVGISSFVREAADSTNENTSDFTNIDLWTSGLFEVTLSTRVVTDGTVWTFTLYEKVDTANFEVVDVDTHTVASDVGASRVRGAFEGGDSEMQVGHQTSTQVGASRTVNLKVRCIGQ
ncbi:right-handed parallel beta-helix repeat-containing protein [Candidatus Pacearchaeota archaeon]|nr:right-handed parallel beta-helix repeat-containing protein [Candidatus Pacearchaeota archaeon]